MFKPKTEKIEKIAEQFPKVIEQLESLFIGETNIYIDEANIRPWSERTKWHIDYKRLKQFLDSFDNVKSTKIYKGTLVGDGYSEKFVEDLKKFNYEVKTKSVKEMKHSIDITSVKKSDISLLEQFIRRCLLKKYDITTIEYLNSKFEELNNQGIYYIEDRKCNFDVEIGRDMLLDFERNNVNTFVLWSGDSDFVDPIEQLLQDNKKAVLFATTRRVAKEFLALQEKLFIFDIKKIKNFICWNREIDEEVKDILERKRDSSKGTPKL